MYVCVHICICMRVCVCVAHEHIFNCVHYNMLIVQAGLSFQSSIKNSGSRDSNLAVVGTEVSRVAVFTILLILLIS